MAHEMLQRYKLCCEQKEVASINARLYSLDDCIQSPGRLSRIEELKKRNMRLQAELNQAQKERDEYAHLAESLMSRLAHLNGNVEQSINKSLCEVSRKAAEQKKDIIASMETKL